jgi:predicted nucleic acid-binding protein
VTLLDAYALIAFLVGGPAATRVRAILREGDGAITTTNLAETLDVSQRVYGLPIERAMEAIDPLLDGPLTTLQLSTEVAVRAAGIRTEHYHRTNCPISLADSVLLAAAMDEGVQSLATSDPDVLEVARIEQIATIVLPQQG